MLNDQKFVEVALRDVVIKLEIRLLIVTCLDCPWFGPVQEDTVISEALHAVPQSLNYQTFLLMLEGYPA